MKSNYHVPKSSFFVAWPQSKNFSSENSEIFRLIEWDDEKKIFNARSINGCIKAFRIKYLRYKLIDASVFISSSQNKHLPLMFTYINRQLKAEFVLKKRQSRKIKVHISL